MKSRHLRILQALSDKPWQTGRELTKTADVWLINVYNALQDLIDEGLVKERQREYIDFNSTYHLTEHALTDGGRGKLVHSDADAFAKHWGLQT